MKKKSFTAVEMLCVIICITVISTLVQVVKLRQDNSKNKRRAVETERVETPSANMAPIPVVNPFAPIQTTTVTVEKWPEQFVITNMEFYSDKQGQCYWWYIKTLKIKNCKTNDEKEYTWTLPEACK